MNVLKYIYLYSFIVVTFRHVMCIILPNLEEFEYSHVGCFNDNTTSRVLSGIQMDHKNLTTEVS